MAREDYGKLFFCCSAFLVSSRPVLTEVLEMSSCRSLRGEFCEPPRGGASARTAIAGVCDSSFTSLPGNNSYFRLALPPVAYSSLPRSLRTIQ